MQGDGLGDMLTLDLFGDILVIDPAQAVAGDLPFGLLHGFDGLRVARQGHGDGVDGHRGLAFGKQPVQSPETGARAIFIEAFHSHGTGAQMALGVDHLRQEGFGAFVAMQDVVLAAFLVVDDELHGDTGPVRPLRVGGIGAIANQIAGVIGHPHTSRAASTAPGVTFAPSPRNTASKAASVIKTLCLRAL